MSQAFYDEIAEWYDNYLSENALYRELVLPTLLELAGDVQGQRICDLACGQGWLTRELARHGALMAGIDLSEQLLLLARQYEEREPLGISYVQGDAQSANLSLEKNFAGCICMLALMDIADLSAVLQTIRHLLKARGAQWIVGEDGGIARAIGSYALERFWRSERGGVRSRVGAYHRTLGTYLNSLSAAGFVLEQVREPLATGQRANQVAGNREIPSLFFVRAHLSDDREEELG